MKKNMPKTIYAVWEEYDRDAPTLVVAENWEDHAVLREKRVVGTYQLVESSYVVSDTKKLPKKR